jgi:hypothetical protein
LLGRGFECEANVVGDLAQRVAELGRVILFEDGLKVQGDV